MESCARCGATDPLCMYGLMSHWFASPAGLALEGGYFYLCPRCFDATIAPVLDELLDKLREHMPAHTTPPPPPTTRGPGQRRLSTDGQPAEGRASAAPPAGRTAETPPPEVVPTDSTETAGPQERKAGPAPEPGDAAGSTPA